jgi:hypothetical protein
MGFFDFLRKKEKEEPKKEISIEKIKAKVKEEDKLLHDNSIKLKEKTKFLLDKIIPPLKSSLLSLGLIDFEKRREDERLKGIVKENLHIYMSHLEILIENLENLNQTADFNDYMTQIGDIFKFFSKNSAKSYEKATILVGEEFEAIQQDFKNFSQEFNSLRKEGLENKEKDEKLSKFAENLQKISDTEKAEEQIKNLILKLDAEKRQKGAEILKKEEELKNLRESESYKKDLEERERIEEERQKLEKEIWMIQKKIDLKGLAGMYHSNEKKHRIIKGYIENFKQAMEEDERMEFAKIVKEAKGLDVGLIEIKERSKKLNNYVSQTEIKIREIEKEAEKIKNELDEAGKNKKAEENKVEKFRKKKEILISELKSEAGEFFKTLKNA